MANGRNTGAGRDILFARGLAEWIGWHVRTGGAEICGQRGAMNKYELMGAADEIVVLLANITQEAI